MKHNLAHNIWSFPTVRFPFILSEERAEEEFLESFRESSGLSVSEDDKCIYVEAAVPGIKPEEIEMSFEKGALWIKAMKNEESEDKNKKYYRKAMSSFSYRIVLPMAVDESKQPDAVCKNGLLKVTFMKKKKTQAKKISVKNG